MMLGLLPRLCWSSTSCTGYVNCLQGSKESRSGNLRRISWCSRIKSMSPSLLKLLCAFSALSVLWGAILFSTVQSWTISKYGWMLFHSSMPLPERIVCSAMGVQGYSQFSLFCLSMWTFCKFNFCWEFGGWHSSPAEGEVTVGEEIFLLCDVGELL